MTSDPGPQVAAVLSPLRPVADEILIAVDASIDHERLGVYESVADKVIRFEFAPPIERAWSWLHAQMSGEWTFRLDGDEVPSAALVAALPRLTDADDVVQYWMPQVWVHPDGRHWFNEWPWWPCFTNRLVRNDARLHFDGLSHSATAVELPARYVEEPFYHLVCAIAPKPDRERKVAYYAGLDDTLKAKDSDRLLRHFYLPEDYATLDPVAIPEDDLRRIEAALDAADGTAPTRARAVRLFKRQEIDAFWAQQPLGASAYRASIEPLSGHRWMRSGDDHPFRVRVRNEGEMRWPGGHAREPQIRLSYRWRSSSGMLVVTEGYRSPLPAPLLPGESCTAPVIVAAPEEPGEYFLELDLVHEGVRWFGCIARVPISVERERAPVRGRAPGRLLATAPTAVPEVLAEIAPGAVERPAAHDAQAFVSNVDRYRWMTAGFHTPFHVHVRNGSRDTWPGLDPERPVRLGYRWLVPSDTRSLEEGFRTAFPVALKPGGETVVPMVVRAPAQPGEYVLEIDLVHEHVRWFDCAVRVEIEVRAPDEAPSLPLPQWAPKWLATADSQFFDRVTRLCGLDHEVSQLCLFRPGEPVDVSIPSLGDAAVRLRPATSDIRVVDDTFWGRYHLPPPEELGPPRVVVDLGSTIGLTMSHFAHLFPEARIVGVELDHENATICRHNIGAWGDRCTILEGAIWSEDTQLEYSRLPGEGWAYRIGSDELGESVTTESMTLDSVLDSVVEGEIVDFLKVDIEGAEQNLFEAGGAWTERVRILKVETHAPYSVAACLEDLGRIGFSAHPDDAHWGAVVAYGPVVGGEPP